VKIKAYRTTMPFNGGLSPLTDKVRKNQPQLGGGPYDKPRKDFDNNMGGDHKFIGPDPDGLSHAIMHPMWDDWARSGTDVPYAVEIVVVDSDGKEHVYDDMSMEQVMINWQKDGKSYKMIMRREKKQLAANTVKVATSAMDISPIVSKILPGCFKIEGESAKYGKKEIGSCFAVEEGKFVTCAHAISKKLEDPNDISIFIVEGENRHRAYPIDVDYDMDIAVVQCDTIRHFPLQVKSIEEVSVGSGIVCVGSPFGYDNNVSRGMVSSKGRVVEGDGRISYFFIDLAVYPGNSGGPVVDLSDGRVIGVAAVIINSVGNYGINAAIPIDYVIRRFPDVNFVMEVL
jgi:hypothetical protein